MMSVEEIWRIIAILSIFGKYESLISLCLSWSSYWYGPIGGTTLYVVLALMCSTNIPRVYKEEEAPLPATRAGFSVILLVALFYFPYSYATIDASIYVYSMFAFGLSVFQLNSPMDTKHVVFTFVYGFHSAIVGFGFGHLFDPECNFIFLSVFVFAILFAKIMFPINGIYI